MLANVGSVPIEKIIEGDLGLDIDYKLLDKDHNILGMTAFNNGYTEVINRTTGEREKIGVTKGTIIIDEHLVEDTSLAGRLRFTFAHEAGHWLLHRHLFEKDENQGVLLREDVEATPIKCLNRNVELIFQFAACNAWDDNDWLEWQADYMAGALLLPIIPFKAAFLGCLRKLDLRQDYLFVDHQRCNMVNYREVLSSLAQTFEVSRRTVEVRLRKLKLITGVGL